VFVIFATWAGLMWVVPYTVDSGTIGDLDGLVGYQDHPETFEDLNPVARAMYKAGDKQCHQKESRTLILNDNEMPFCARDVGIYTLMAIGIAISMFPRLPKYDRLTDIKWYWMVIALVPIGIDGTGQLFEYWESTNPMRLFTGGLCGFVVGLALGFMLRELGGFLKEVGTDLGVLKTDVQGAQPQIDEKED
jgi:uncharacterized membrane protein